MRDVSGRESASGPAFPATHWSLIFLAGNRERDEGSAALGEVVETYRQPLMKHLEFKFATNGHQAGEWLDGFVEKRILEKDLLAQARQTEGRFRGFLVTSLDRFVLDQIRHANRKQRKPEGGLQSLEGLAELPATTTDARAVDPGDRAWALSVLELARARTEHFYRHKQKTRMWEVFLLGCYLPLRDFTVRPADAELASRLGFESGPQVSNAITTVKRKFGSNVREIVAQYVPPGAEAEIDQEIRDLILLLSDESWRSE